VNAEETTWDVALLTTMSRQLVGPIWVLVGTGIASNAG
jgi:hypothetical protein